MAINIFRRSYTIRRHGEQKIVNGYSVSNKTDFSVKLNVQPLSKNDLLALPEGDRTVKRIKSYGSVSLISSDEHSGIMGDLLYYDGKWYECTTCIHWTHTPLAHYESEFVILADQSKQKPPNAGGDSVEDKSVETNSV